MKFVPTLLALVGIHLSLAAATAPYCPPRPASQEEQAKIFSDFVNTFVMKGDFVSAFRTHVADSYIQHNPSALSGRENTLSVFKDRPAPKGPNSMKNTIINQGVANNIAFVHYKSESSPRPKAIVDLFRMDGTCVMEHWDVIQERPENPKNPLAMWSRR